MADSKAVSIRIPDELLAKIDDLAERKYKSIKGKPNRSLVILDALVSHFDKLPATENRNNAVTLNDTVTMQDFQELQNLVNRMIDEIEQLKKTVTTVSDSADETNVVNVEQKSSDQLELIQIIKSTVSDTVDLEATTEIEISLELLAKRLNLKNPKSISNKKTDISDSEFANWTAKKDADGISWKPVNRGKRVYFTPVCEISSEQQEALLNWIKQNSIAV